MKRILFGSFLLIYLTGLFLLMSYFFGGTLTSEIIMRVIFGIIVLLWMKRLGVLEIKDFRWAPWMLGFGFLIYFLTGSKLFSISVVVDVTKPNLRALILIILWALSIGFFEEILYRGLGFRYMLPKGRFIAAIVSSVVFGALHISTYRLTPGTLIFLILTGSISFYLTGIYWRTGSLIQVIFLHALFDFGTLILMAFPGGRDYITDAFSQGISETAIPFQLGLSALFALLGLKHLRHEPQTKEADLP